MTTYLDVLAELGIDSAHPGGFSLTKNILRKLNIQQTSSILDVGCGTGQTAAYIAEQYRANVTAIDIHPTMLQKAKKRFASLSHPVHLYNTSIESLPFSSEQFDVILCESVLSFVSLSKALQEIYRVLKPKGKLLSIEVAHSQLTETEKKDITSFYGFRHLLTEQQWEAYLHKNGFHKVQTAYHPVMQQRVLAATPFTITADVSEEMLTILHTHEHMTKQYGRRLGYCIFSCEK
ncbi:class I SAM-dependent methyltransferase [Thermaerobacillus caldiproteolyticus]|uniref:class I SAM-dependent methyltransferase n=1 Tax=Thermaerobacillus caldiproteolyticus TaxID=247480 RepID=UPI00188DB53D|nr:class I SAM-dependent methyltransferase [Anoxybacillus caldiproteolyticus]QPA32693.1 class I SAM-dependent methyltransferase [Anoxybacillus caldiproteolyticus]